MVQRKRHSAEFKAKVALAALKGQQTLNELAGLYGVHPVQVAQWKKQAAAGLPEVFASRRVAIEQETEALQARLYQEIGQLKVELDWLKRKTGLAS
jgi:transposase-like protein